MSMLHSTSVIRLAPVRFAFCLLSLTAVCGVARGDVMNLGLMSWDEINPGAVNGLTVINFTFDFSLPPDFPIVDKVIFKNAEVVLTDDLGTALAPILLGDLGPGVAQPPSLQFLSTQLFQSAEFQATLNGTSFSISGGSIFVADTTAIDALLLPGVGPTLVPGADFVPITATGTITTAPIPEPSGWVFLLTLILALAALRKSRSFVRPSNG